MTIVRSMAKERGCFCVPGIRHVCSPCLAREAMRGVRARVGQPFDLARHLSLAGHERARPLADETLAAWLDRTQPERPR